MDHLIKYDWPGNVRELMNAVERGVVLARSDYLDAEDVPIIQKQSEISPEKASTAATMEKAVLDHQPLDMIEKEFILKTLESAGGNKSETARRLGITRKTLHKKLKSYGVMP